MLKFWQWYLLQKTEFEKINKPCPTPDLTQLTTLQEEKRNLLVENDQLKQENSALIEKAKQEPVSEFDLLPQASKNKAKEYLTKYPEAAITYSGRGYPQDVRSFVGEGWNNFNIQNFVAKAKQNVKQENYSDYHLYCDALVQAITSAFNCHYIFDNGECWLYPSELFAFDASGIPKDAYPKAGRDCEDYAITRYVMCRMAGVPAELLRVTTGQTRRGEGHCSNHYIASDLKWHHLNSTTNFGSAFSVLSTPLNDDAGDVMGFDADKIWFSFNEFKAWHEFKTSAASDSFRESPRMKYVQIKRLD